MPHERRLIVRCVRVSESDDDEEEDYDDDDGGDDEEEGTGNDGDDDEDNVGGGGVSEVRLAELLGWFMKHHYWPLKACCLSVLQTAE